MVDGDVFLVGLQVADVLDRDQAQAAAQARSEMGARGEDLIEESLKSLEEEFGGRFVRIHRNCLVARHELVEIKRVGDGHVQAILRHGKAPLEVSRRCVAGLRETVKAL